MTFRWDDKDPRHDVHEGAVNFYMQGCAYGRIKICVRIPRGKTKAQQVDVYLSARTVLALADAIRCCPDRINEDPATGRKGAEFPPEWIGHAFWHLEHPDQPRPCLDHSRRMIDVLDPTALLDGAVIDVEAP